MNIPISKSSVLSLYSAILHAYMGMPIAYLPVTQCRLGYTRSENVDIAASTFDSVDPYYVVSAF